MGDLLSVVLLRISEESAVTFLKSLVTFAEIRSYPSN